MKDKFKSIFIHWSVLLPFVASFLIAVTAQAEDQPVTFWVRVAWGIILFVPLFIITIIIRLVAISDKKKREFQQIKTYYKQITPSLLDDVNLWVREVNTAILPLEYFPSYEILTTTLEHLVPAEAYIPFCGKTPSRRLADVKAVKSSSLRLFINRAVEDIEKETSFANKCRRYSDFFWELSLYDDQLSASEQDYIENIKRLKYDPLIRISNSLSAVSDGYEFEYFIASLLEKNNFINVNTTPKSGDYGIDVLAEKDSLTYAIQCKFYSTPVGTSAIQEAATGKTYYGTHAAIVATNSTFTANAKILANKVGIALWDIDTIVRMGNLHEEPEINKGLNL